MPAPTASPTVSSTVGLKNMVIAPLTEDTEEGTTYGTLQAVAGAIEATITPESADPDVQYADDHEFDTLYPDPEVTFSTSCLLYTSSSRPRRATSSTTASSNSSSANWGSATTSVRSPTTAGTRP